MMVTSVAAHADMVNKIVDDLFCLSFGNPEDVAGLYIDDVGRVPMTVMELELINPEILCLAVWLDESLAVNGIFLLKPLLVDLLDGILAQPSDLGNLFIGVSLERQQIADVLVECIRNHVAGSLETDELFLDCPAVAAPELNMWEPQTAQINDFPISCTIGFA